jgi:trimeric autotransporter adhesin
MAKMFGTAITFTYDIEFWNVYRVTDMTSMFFVPVCSTTYWTLECFQWMANMFFGAATFNQDIGCWDVSSVVTMRYMFGDVRAFNQNLRYRNVDNVMPSSGICYGAFSFRPLLLDWEVDSEITALRSDY